MFELFYDFFVYLGTNIETDSNDDLTAENFKNAMKMKRQKKYMAS